ncbi:hypothetical protein ACWGI8_09610 [Streptomyces sp. NPDC054841]
MGIESDQLVFDYLSRVGDLAQQRQLPSGTRMRLVSSLRNEIDRQRAKYETDSPAAVRRILGRLGTPDEVVDAAADGAPAATAATAAPSVPAVPEQRNRSGRRIMPRTRRSEGKDAKGTRPSTAASPPHLAGMDELGPSAGAAPDWWRVEPGPLGGHGGQGDDIGGFVGGVEIPEILKPPRRTDQAEGERAGSEDSEDSDKYGEYGEYGEHDASGESEAGETDPARRRWRPRLRRRTGGARPGNPLLLFAAVLLAVGTVLGSWIALAGGWLLAYASRTLSRREAKGAVIGLPAAVATGAAIWLWGRVDGRWGEPIPRGGEAMREALSSTWPWVVRGAALATALYLVWRARRK